MRILPSKAHGTIIAPASKSQTHRALICACLSDGVSTLRNIEESDDVRATISCLENLGAKIEINNKTATITGFGKKPETKENSILDCNESASTLRFLIPLALLCEKQAIFTGEPGLLVRPMSVYEELFKEHGIIIERTNETIEVSGQLKPNTYIINANISSQFISGLLFVLPLLEGDSTIVLSKDIVSRPYIDLTMQVQKAFGVSVFFKDERTISIPGRQSYKPTECTIEGDHSNSSFFEALNFFGGNVDVKGLNEDSIQPDSIYRQYFKALQNDHCTLDITSCPDLAPILMVVSSVCHGCILTGTRRLAFKESDRAQSMKEELEKFGIKVEVNEDSIEVHKAEIHEPKEEVFGHNDHRIVMALSVLLSYTGGELVGHEAVKKSLPDFFTRLKALGVEVLF